MYDKKAAKRAYDQTRYQQRRSEVVERVRQWRLANPELYANQHRRAVLWRERMLIRKAKQTARRYGLPDGDLTVEAIVGIVAQACTYCGKAPAGGFDHAMPMSRGGSNTVANLVPACLPCNQSKSARDQPTFGQKWAARVNLKPGG